MPNYQQPDARGHYGPVHGSYYGGTFVAETLIHALDQLRAAYDQARRDPAFDAEFRHELKHFVGRPSPVYHAARLSREIGGAQIHLKREDLNHTAMLPAVRWPSTARLSRRSLRSTRTSTRTSSCRSGRACWGTSYLSKSP